VSVIYRTIQNADILDRSRYTVF